MSLVNIMPWSSLRTSSPPCYYFSSVQVTVDLITVKGLHIALGSILLRNINSINCGLCTIKSALCCLPLRFTSAIWEAVCMLPPGELENGARSVYNYEFKTF